MNLKASLSNRRFVRVRALALTALLALAWQSPAHASGDFSCSAAWKLSHKQYSGCDNMALLGPGNDTRVNLVLLLFDARSRTAPPPHASNVPPDRPTPAALFEWPALRDVMFPPAALADDSAYADGEGSRCLSNANGIAAFEAAVKDARGLPENERTDLVAARRALQPTCSAASGGAAIIAGLPGRMRSEPGRAFARYLQGALAFYDGDYDAAAAHFAALNGAGQPWLRETARYMLGRVEVNRAQVDAFDEFGSRKDTPIDARVIARAEAGLLTYLHDYPNGAYAASARGLLRRVYWLGGNEAKLAATYVSLFAQGPAGLDDSALADEIDTKLLPTIKPADTTDPILLAVLDLAAMRSGESDTGNACCGTPITLARLQAQRPAFAANPALFDYLLAAHAWFVENKPAEVLRLIPDAARQKKFSYLQFSRQVLRGMALDALRDRNARGFWLDLLPGATLPYQHAAIELALALHDERTAALGRVFEPGSPVSDPVVREILLANVAGAPLLRQQARNMAAPLHEREVALFTLLFKEVTRGAPRDFVADLAMVPAAASREAGSIDVLGAEHPWLGVFTHGAASEGYACPSLRETATQLAGDPRGIKARLCLAEFVRLNGFDEYALDSQPPKDELGGTPSLLPGTPFSRLEIYKAIIADPTAAPADKAYALYRAVNCYGPSGNNSCGGVEVEPAQRKAWFLRLKKDYATTTWSKQQRYFW
ncbi:hypothetical protein GCM10009087_04520 [Sphingomonas oligophenolica]|uniref:Outer membrane assembly lipoprotein YfiO n=1 Tax=Sphingomonas oligophenolica TaxID=301154 RepID=A0ABU9Y5V9_9SPHN